MQLWLDHLYRETHHWTDSVVWWSNLGFSFTEQWGEAPHRAGRLVRSATEVVLAEVPLEQDASESTFLTTDDVHAVAEQVGGNVIDTHWGTRMVTVTDPDGRVYAIEPGKEA